jgi:hypothetical protein
VSCLYSYFIAMFKHLGAVPFLQREVQLLYFQLLEDVFETQRRVCWHKCLFKQPVHRGEDRPVLHDDMDILNYCLFSLPD